MDKSAVQQEYLSGFEELDDILDFTNVSIELNVIIIARETSVQVLWAPVEYLQESYQGYC